MSLHSSTAAPWHQLGSIPVANIGDAVDRLGMVDSGIKPVWPGARILGPAFTVWTREGDNLGIHDAIDAAPEGSVIVVNGGGFTSRALLGELMAGRAHQRGILGFVVDGSVRDAGELGRLQIPVFARGISPAGPYKNGPFRTQVPIALGGVSVAPGDIVAGDDDGIVVVAQDDVDAVLDAARAVQADEENRRAAIWSDQ